MNKVTVAICGGFDPPHEGHMDHILQAGDLGDLLIVMVNPDEDMVRKKHWCLLNQQLRMSLVNGWLSTFKINGYAVEVIDTDGTVAETLKLYRPHIFAKGGDRVESNMPQKELDVCRELGIEIRYNVGELLGSSSRLFENAVGQYLWNKYKIPLKDILEGYKTI